jgi:tetratricopeptide (TPR) repeat protein
VSAAPRPKTEPDSPVGDDRARTGSDEDGWALLEALRRRLDDQAAQGRKTQVQVGQLADSIASLVSEQRRRSKWLNLNSFVAYLIFTVVVGAGFYALYQSRASELLEARNTARHERDLATQRADETTSKLAAREKADATAWEAYQLLEAGKRTDAQAKLATLGPQALSRTERAVLAARAHETQIMEVEAALKAAAASFKAGRYGDVIAPLEAALVGEPSGARAGAMHYFVGVAYAKGNELAKAIPHLQIAVATDSEHIDVRFQLASALDRSGQYAKARAEYDQFATAYPQSGLAVFALRRSATLARMPAVAPNTPALPSPTKAPAGAAPTTPGAKATTAPTGAAPAAPSTTPTTKAAPAGAVPAPSTTPGAPPSGAKAVTPGTNGTTVTVPTTTTAPIGAKPSPKWPTQTPGKTTPPTPKPAPKPAAPQPVEEPAPAPAHEGSAATTPMSTTPFDLREGMSTAEVAPATSPRDDRQSISTLPRTNAPTTTAPLTNAAPTAPKLAPDHEQR